MRAAERLGICLGFSLASPVAALTVYEVAPDVADVWFVAVTIGAAPAVGYLIGPVIWPDASRSQAALVGLAATAAGYGALFVAVIPMFAAADASRAELLAAAGSLVLYIAASAPVTSLGSSRGFGLVRRRWPAASALSWLPLIAVT